MTDKDKRMSAERLAEWMADIDDCMDWITTPDIRELLQAIKAEREKVEELEAGCDRLHEYIAEKDKRIEELQSRLTKVLDVEVILAGDTYPIKIGAIHEVRIIKEKVSE